MSAAKAALIYTTVPDAPTARAMAGTLLEERLIACANILGSIEAVFVWKGTQESASECAVLFKTSEACMERAVNRAAALHPYETPAIVASVCDAAHSDTLSWLVEQTR